MNDVILNANCWSNVERDNMSFCNDYASLDFYKQSVKGIVQDFIFAFKEEQTDIQHILNIALV